MFYHVKLSITAIDSWFEVNKGKEELIMEYVCPFINGEVVLDRSLIFNMKSFGSMRIYKTENPVDSDWPIKKSDYYKANYGSEEKKFDRYSYERALEEMLKEHSATETIYKECVFKITKGEYVKYINRYVSDSRSKQAFVIMQLGNEDLDHTYEYAIKPAIIGNKLECVRVDEISHTEKVDQMILDKISESILIVADLTNNRPNCYYEVGYAHSLGKKVIIVAKEGAERHFDISTYKWTMYRDYQDLKKKLEKEIKEAINSNDILNNNL